MPQPTNICAESVGQALCGNGFAAIRPLGFLRARTCKLRLRATLASLGCQRHRRQQWIAGGYTFVESASLAAGQARLFWSAKRDPNVLRVRAGKTEAVLGAFDIAKLAHLVWAVVDADGAERLSLSDGRQCLRIDIVIGTLLQGPVRLQFLDNGANGLAPLARSLSILAFLLDHKRFPVLPRGHSSFARRQIDCLRTYDALLAGASQRDIAIAFFGFDRTVAEWNGRSDAMRSHVRRLCKMARHLAGGGYKTLALI
jgi:hypothetical protein